MSDLPKTVKYVRLGRSGLKVSQPILGCMTYGTPGWLRWTVGGEGGPGTAGSEDDAIAHLKAAWDLGINTWDTANVYSNGDSEKIVGRAIRKLGIPRSEIIIMTKCFFAVNKDVRAPLNAADLSGRDYVNQHGLSRAAIFNQVEASLKRLQLDYIDVLQCHRFDYDTPVEETMDALDSLVKSGKVRAIGMSACYAYQFAQMQNYALRKGQTTFISMQDQYSPVYREEEREMFPTLEHFGVGSIPYSPLAKGFCARPWREQKSQRATEDPAYAAFIRPGNDEYERRMRNINEAIEEVANNRGYTMAQVTLAWVMSNDAVASPIVGSTRLESITELVQATHIVLTQEEIASINAHYVPVAINGFR